MKKILIILLFCGFWANAQQYHDKGAKFEFATNEGDTITVNTRIPIIDEFGLINYYVDVSDLLALNPTPVLEWGNITGTLSNQTDLQGALNDKADQSALTAHTSNGNIHFTQSAISITESQITDFKDYLRGDINDTNGSNKLTLGSLEVVGQTTLQNGLNLTSIPTGTSNNILTINGTGDVEQRVFSLGDIDIANAAGVNQFPVGLGDQLRIQGSGDTSISFDGITNTININSTPGSGGGGAVTSFNGRDGAVVSQAGDYSTAMVNENTNLYFTEPRVRATPLTGLTVTNTPISSTNTFLQALGRLQGQINDRYTISEADEKYLLNTTDVLNGNLGVTGNGSFEQGKIVTSSAGDRPGFSMINNGDASLGTSIRLVTSNQEWRILNTYQTIDRGFAVRNNNLNANAYELDGTNNNATFFGALIGTSHVIAKGGVSPLELHGTGTGDNNGNFMEFFESNGTVRQAYVGFTQGSSTFRINNDVGNNQLELRVGNPENDFIYRNANGARIVYHTGNLTLSTLGGEPAFSKNTAFNKNFGTASGTVAQGNDSRINNGQTAFGWGNHASAGYAIMNDDNNNSGQLTIVSGNTLTSGYRAKNANTSQSSFMWMDDSNIFNIWNSGAASRPVHINVGGDGGLVVGGNVTASGDVIANSDKRLKKNIKRIDNALAIVQLLGGYEYDRKDIDLHQAGVIAQEVEEVFPVAVSEDANGTKSVAYNQLIALLIEAIKEQQIEIENLKTLINEK